MFPEAEKQKLTIQRAIKVLNGVSDVSAMGQVPLSGEQPILLASAPAGLDIANAIGTCASKVRISLFLKPHQREAPWP